MELDPWRMTNFLVSTDQGKTWQRRGGVRPPKNPCWDEPAVFEKADGGLVCLIRTRDGRVETQSYDHGFNWSKPVPSAIPHAVGRIMTLRLASGRILMVKHGPLHGDNPIPNRTHLTAYLSDDDGVSWRGGLLLEERGCRLPDGFQVDDGRIYGLRSGPRSRPDPDGRLHRGGCGSGQTRLGPRAACRSP